jgi:TolB-like protein
VWRAEVGEAIEGADKVLFYISAASLKSDHCNREISVALDEEKAILPVYLQDTPLTPDLKVGLARLQAIHRTEDDDYQRHLLEALGQTTPVDSDPPPANQSRPLSKYAVRVEKPMIAVLPFDNLSGDIEQEFFSEGIAEDILNGLAHNAGLVVRARNSSFSFKGQQLDTGTVAERLNVTHIVNGSVRTSGNRVRVNARLTAVAQDVDVWSDRYDRELADVFAVQDEITQSILNALDLHFSGSERQRVSLDAYDAFLRGRYHSSRFQIPEAISAFEKAIEMEADYAEALSALADMYGILDTMGAFSGDGHRENIREKVGAYCERALKVNPDAPVGVASMFFELQDRVNELNRLIRRYPNNPGLFYSYGTQFRRIGRSDLEIRVQDQQVALDPLNPDSFRVRGDAKLFDGRFEEAMEDFETCERLGGVQMTPYAALLAFHRRDIEALEQLVEDDSVGWIPLPHFRTIMAAAVPYLRGDALGVRQTLSPVETQDGYVSNYVKFWTALLKEQYALALEHYRAALREGEFLALHEIRGYHGSRTLFPEYFAQPGYEAMLREFELDAESVAKLVIPDFPF